jgi:hypothetical protein
VRVSADRARGVCCKNRLHAVKKYGADDYTDIRWVLLPRGKCRSAPVFPATSVSRINGGTRAWTYEVIVCRLECMLHSHEGEILNE